MKKIFFYIIVFTYQMAFADGEWLINTGYSFNRSPVLNDIHRNYAFTRLSNDTGISFLKHGFFLQAGAQFNHGTSARVFSFLTSWSRFAASQSRSGFINVAIHRINIMPALAWRLVTLNNQQILLSAGPLAGFHVFSLNKYGEPLELEENRPYRPAFFNWGIHTAGTSRLKLKGSHIGIFIQAEWYPIYNTGNYSAALLGTTYPWIKTSSFTMSFNAGLAWSLPWSSAQTTEVSAKP